VADFAELFYTSSAVL